MGSFAASIQRLQSSQTADAASLSRPVQNSIGVWRSRELLLEDWVSQKVRIGIRLEAQCNSLSHVRSFAFRLHNPGVDV
jgi:hypothetical protein